jgi:DNA-binding XRE family transcriptional regulator
MRKKPSLTPAELKMARARLGFSQEKLAFELGVNRLSVVRWEGGIHRIPLMVTLAIKQLELEICELRDGAHLLEHQISD